MCESAPGVFDQDVVTALRFLWNTDKLLEENIFLPKKANVSHVVIPVESCRTDLKLTMNQIECCSWKKT